MKLKHADTLLFLALVLLVGFSVWLEYQTYKKVK